MQVKIFINGDCKQDVINEWLTSNDIDIKHIKQNMIDSGAWGSIISIWYTDKKVSKSRTSKQFSQEAYNVMEFFRNRTGKNFQDNDANLKLAQDRLNEGYSESDLMRIIRQKTKDVKAGKFDVLYLRPKTLFNKTNAANYQGEI